MDRSEAAKRCATIPDLPMPASCTRTPTAHGTVHNDAASSSPTADTARTCNEHGVRVRAFGVVTGDDTAQGSHGFATTRHADVVATSTRRRRGCRREVHVLHRCDRARVHVQGRRQRGDEVGRGQAVHVSSGSGTSASRALSVTRRGVNTVRAPLLGNTFHTGARGPGSARD